VAPDARQLAPIDPIRNEGDEVLSSERSRRDVLNSAGVLTGIRPSDAQAAPIEASEAEVRELVEALDAERQAWIEGRFDPDAAGKMIQATDMTIFGPFGGEPGSGGPDLHARQKRVNASFQGGSGQCEVVRSIASGDLLVLIMIERNRVTFEGRSEPRAWTLRTTQVFRRDGDHWVRLHRHADPLLSRRSLDETLALLESP
jgi:ketosteroid isomerase-like protein